MALEDEIARWKPFRNALQDDKSRDAFDWMMDMCRNNCMASGNACNPTIFEPMVMSILLAQQNRLDEFEHKLNVLWKRICAEDKVAQEG